MIDKRLVVGLDNSIQYYDENNKFKIMQNEEENINEFLLRVNKTLKVNMLDQEDNIILAKRMIVDNIYSSAMVEGIGATFAETEEIINNTYASTNLRPNDITFIINMKRAWEFILDKDNINRDIDLVFMEELHEIVARGLETLKWNEIGKIRQDGVMISGTTWRPEIPNAEKLFHELNELNKNPDPVDKAMNLNLWVCRRQIFKDGNKRIGNLICNHELIKNGSGIFVVKDGLSNKYKQLLVDYYESGKTNKIKEFILNNSYVNDKEGLVYTDKSIKYHDEFEF